uniref:Uncharacterized protein n=1 Tax=Arundo donax TaxID=35708 RepID=A0A0A8XY24_ARUDO
MPINTQIYVGMYRGLQSPYCQVSCNGASSMLEISMHPP